ncbi:MAG: TetR/AcrR family transcriptional regulator [Chitinophagaceae bacterium]|nr:TetR/AcrR family transcriptional regulator [Oligoflexus sp.]
MKPVSAKKCTGRQNDRNASECKLLEAAEQMFTKLGFDASTTRMIAANAGVNLALISKYFGSKEGLLLSLLERKTDQILNCSLGYPEQPDLLSELRAHYEYLLGIHGAMGAVMMKIVISKGLTDESFCCQIQNRLRHESKPLLDRLEKFQKAGKIRPDVDVHQIEEQVRSYFQSQAFFAMILLHDTKDNVKNRLGRFAETLVKAYSA